jgi:hypothetical protein
MKRNTWISLGLTVLILTSALFFLGNYLTKKPSEEGFRLVSIENNALLISDVDILSYNWTSQEMSLTDLASQRLRAFGSDLYSYSGGFTITINGEKVYQGIFRAGYMSAIPAPPKISILFPSLLYPSSVENPKAMMLFYPSGKPPGDQPEANEKLLNHFKQHNKLTY